MSMAHLRLFPLFLLLQEFSTLELAYGQILSRLAPSKAPDGTDHTNQTFLITRIGPGGGTGNELPYPLFCFTSDNNNVVWQFPNGTYVPLIQQGVFQASGNQLFVVEFANRGVALLRGSDYLSPTGDYCCVSIISGERRCITFIEGPCPVLTTPLNGEISYSGFDSSLARYSCDTGYQLTSFSNTATRTCQNSSWTGSEPTCQPIDCGALTGPANGRVDTSSGTTFRSKAIYSCNTGYYLVGSTNRTCQSSGDWSLEIPQCESIMCSTLPDPANGIIVYNTSEVYSSAFEVGATARYQCNPGNGFNTNATVVSPVRTCQSGTGGPSGVWTGKALSCSVILCPALGALENGIITYDTAPPHGLSTEATHICNSSYHLVGNRIRNCKGDGSRTTNGEWDNSPPICVSIKCPLLTSLSNGRIHITPPMSCGSTLIDHGSVAHHSCERGYYLDGNQLRTCLDGGSNGTTGSWNGAPPTCRSIECPALDVPTSGSITFDSDTTAPHAFTTRATYHCSEGYGLSGGDRVITCTNSTEGPGEWKGTVPACQAVMCDTLRAPDNGRIVYSPDVTSPYNFGTVATCVCDSGYGLSGGTRTVICGRDDSSPVGLWEGSIPSCLAITCGSLPLVSNGVISYSPDMTERFSFGTVGSYACNEGFYLEDRGNERRACGGDGLNPIGSWDGTGPSCIAISCNALSTPSNGAIDYSHDPAPPFEYQTIATYSCNMGFGLVGESTVRTCVGSVSGPGEWNGTVPACEVLTCASLNDPINGQIEYTSGTTALHDFCTVQVATYVCDSGNGLVGDNTRTCEGSTGTWSGNPATCVDITCASLPSINNGTITYAPDTADPFRFNTVASFACADGFFLNGDTTRICRGNGSSPRGSWSGDSPECLATECSSLSSPVNGVVELTKIPSGEFTVAVAIYRCNEGFVLSRLSGDRVRICTASRGGKWTGIEPMCEAVMCDTLHAPDNGHIVYSPDVTSPYNFGTVATCVCDSGYGLSGGTRTLRCGGNDSSPVGLWGGSTPSCLAITCGSLPLVSNGVISYSPDMTEPFSFGTVGSYACNEGFYLEDRGNERRTCGGNGLNSIGSWNGTGPSCIAISCNALSAPSNGAIDYSHDPAPPFEYQTIATYSCNMGFGLVGESTVRTCVGSVSGPGEWNGTVPACEVLTCASLNDPINGRIEYTSGTTALHDFGTVQVATYVCDSGYGLVGDNSRTCEGSTGAWSGSPATCVAITCGSLPLVSNGVISYSPEMTEPFSFGTVGSYACNEGFYLEDRGNERRTCGGNGLNPIGSWNGTGPSCIAISCNALSAPSNGAIDYSHDPAPPFEYQTIATYSCNMGFGLVGGSTVRTCVGSVSGPGEWNGTVPACEVLTCASLNDPINGRIEYTSGTTALHDFGTVQVATYVCDSGYGLVGDNTRTCEGSTGTWSGRPAACVDITCTSLPSINHGTITYAPDTADPFRFNTVASFACADGFFLNGDTTRTCGGNGSSPRGSWSGGNPLCLAVECSSLSSPLNGVVELTETMSGEFTVAVATYHCNEGFLLSSRDRVRICTASRGGKWTGIEPMCEAIDCGALIGPANGQVDTSSGTTFRSEAIYSCNHGYYLAGSTTRTCQSSGNWSQETPSCKYLPSVVLPSTSSSGNTYFVVALALAVGLAIAVLVIFTLVAILIAISKQLRQSRAQLKQASLANPIYDLPQWPDNVDMSKTGSNSGTSGKGATMSQCPAYSSADDVLTQDTGTPENNN